MARCAVATDDGGGCAAARMRCALPLTPMAEEDGLPQKRGGPSACVTIHTGTCDKRCGSGPCSVGPFFISPQTSAPPLRGAFLGRCQQVRSHSTVGPALATSTVHWSRVIDAMSDATSGAYVERWKIGSRSGEPSKAAGTRSTAPAGAADGASCRSKS